MPDIRHFRASSGYPACPYLSRSYCSAVSSENQLYQLHAGLCHPGIVRMAHLVRCRNLPYSMEDIKRMTAACAICTKLKPNFYRPPPGQLVKATQPFERLNMDFKGPLPTAGHNKYILTIVDEFSRFPFAYPCPDVSANSVIKSLNHLFYMFGTPSYIHTDRGAAFMSSELRTFLCNNGVSTSRSTPYNPQGNGQVERYNGIIWKSVLLALESRKLTTPQWETVLPDALHSIRTLLSTATNETPHERFFRFQRKSSVYDSPVPSWLSMPGKVYLKRSVRASKHDPLVDEVELLQANPNYAHVRFPDGQESSVSTRYLAPYSPPDRLRDDSTAPGLFDDDSSGPDDFEDGPLSSPAPPKTLPPHDSPRRSTRATRPPDRLQISF